MIDAALQIDIQIKRGFYFSEKRDTLRRWGREGRRGEDRREGEGKKKDISGNA